MELMNFAAITYRPAAPSNEPPINAPINSPIIELTPPTSAPADNPVLVETLPTPEQTLELGNNDTFWQGIINNDVLIPLLGQLSLGGILGLATGYALKKALKFVLFTVGILFILLQVGVYFEVVSVDWLRVQEIVNPFLERDSLERNWRSFLKLLTANIPFAGGFIPMLFVGLRMK